MSAQPDSVSPPPPDQHPLDALLAPWRDRRSGVLRLRRGTAHRQVYYHQGEVVQADSDLPKESLFYALEAMGTIDAELRARAEAAAREGPARPIQVLVDSGALKADDVRTLLRRRAEQLVAACLAWKMASSSFRPTAAMPALPSPPVKVALPRVLLQGASRFLPPADVEAMLLPSHAARPRGAPTARLPVADVGLTPPQFDFYCSLDGARSLEEVLNFSALPREEAARVVLVLERLGLVQFDPAPATAGDRGPGAATPSAAPEEEEPPPRPSGLDAEALFGPGFAQVRAPVVRKADPAPQAVEIDEVTGADLREVRTLMPSDRQRYFETREQIELSERQNHFERLGLSPEASELEIRNAYFALAKRCHPDALQAYAEPIRDAAGTLFARVSEAYEVLIDPESRRRYIDHAILGKPDENEQAMREVRAIMEAEQAFKRGLKLLNAGKLLDAHQDFSRAVELYPSEHEYSVYLGWTTFKLHHPKDAEAADGGEAMIRQALKENTRLDKGWHLLGRVMMARENWEQAKAFLRQAIKLQPANGEAVRDYKHCDARTRGDPSGSSPLAGLFSRFKKS